MSSSFDPSAAMAPPQNITINLFGIYGAALITTFIATAVWGVNSVQAIYYFFNPLGDRWPIKALVLWLLSCETIRLVLTITGLFSPMVVHWGDLENLQRVLGEFEYQNVFYALVTVSAQAYFIYRIYILSGRKFWLIPLSIIVLAFEFGSVLTIVIRTHNYTSNAEVVNDTVASTLVWFITGTNLAVDVCLAATLCLLLQRENTGPGLKSTDSIVFRLTIFTICTGLLTAVVQFTVIIAHAYLADHLVDLSLEFLISGLYVMSVLANLNGRPWIRYGRGGSSFGLSNLSSGTKGSDLKFSDTWKPTV